MAIVILMHNIRKLIFMIIVAYGIGHRNYSKIVLPVCYLT